MNIPNFLIFDEYDNPMQLSKVGNWVITFLSPKEQLDQIELAITSVVPRHAQTGLQPYRIHLHQTESMQKWQIGTIECYDADQHTERVLAPEHPHYLSVIDQVVFEFKKYDVEIELA